MTPLISIILLSLLAGLAMPLGGIIAKILATKNVFATKTMLAEEFNHFVLAFGAGALLAAVTLILVPEGSQALSVSATAAYFSVGALVFMAFDIWLARLKTSASLFIAMMADFIPESIVLGATFSIDPTIGMLLAGLMAIQNIPEGYNAYQELKSNTRFAKTNIIMLFSLFSILGPLCALLGFYWLANESDVTAAIMLIASGGILYSVFQDIAPKVPIENHYFPPTGAVFGFLFGLIGFMLST